MATGSALSLTATASGATSWKFTKDGSDIVGATGTGSTATYTVASAQAANAGTYQAVFTNSVGTVSTIAATVTVTP